GTSAKSIVSDKISNIKMLSAVQCLGIQLPIHCLDSLFENFTFALKSLGDGEFFNSLESWLDSFSLPPGISDALAKLEEYKDLITEKITNLELLNKVFDGYEYLQGKMQMVLGSIGSLVGCIDRSAGTDLTRHLDSVTNPLSELNTDFKASIDAVKSSKEHFTNPTDILNDSKS
ncbi:MAG: hypothetical protein GY710_04635, partial [Desulfobacteraceae bacterium]|nr:hypothetical protein [Desulfobacteraceae bacterium]